VTRRAAWALAAALGGCGAEPRAAAPPLTPAAAAAARTAGIGAAAHWARRSDETELRAAIDGWSRAAAARPADVATGTALARAHHFLADGHRVFVKDRDPAAYLAALDACAATADATLAARWPAFGEKRALGVAFEDALALVAEEREAAPLLYWWSQCRMLAANERGLGATIAAHQAVFTVMARVAALDPDYWYAGADRYLGVIYAAAPAIAGGDLVRSRDHFEAARARAPGFLETDLLYGMFHRDRARLEAVARGEGADGDPAIAAEQAVARRKAALLLEQT